MSNEYKTMDLPEFNVVGLEVSTSVEECTNNNPHPKLWKDFMQRLGEVKNKVGHKFYGVSFVTGECTFDSLAAVEVEDLDHVPEGMVGKKVPENKYLVFTHQGKVENLSETYKDLYENKLPNSGFKQKDVWLEVYDERFKEDSHYSEMDIYVAVD